MSSFKEALSRLLPTNRKGSEGPKKAEQKETQREVAVNFFDLREEAAAEERGVNPGYYLTVHPILPNDLENPGLLRELSPLFFDVLIKQGLLQRSGTRIFIDRKGQLPVDPSHMWSFTPAGYVVESQLFVVQANHIDPNDAQRLLIKTLR